MQKLTELFQDEALLWDKYDALYWNGICRKEICG